MEQSMNMSTITHTQIDCAVKIPYPYNYMISYAVKENGRIRWFDIESQQELPPYIGYPDDLQEQIDSWYLDRGVDLGEQRVKNVPPNN